VATQGRALLSEQLKDSVAAYYKGGKAKRIPPTQAARNPTPTKR
jgi:hypothetical protein